MDKPTLNKIIRCLPRGRSLCRYYSGRFAWFLLSQVADRYKTIGAPKQTPYARLIERPDVENVLATQGSGALDRETFARPWQDPSFCFRLSLGRWGGTPGTHGQVSCRGVNLVLQLNFSNERNREYRRFFQPTEDNLFNFYRHPVAFLAMRSQLLRL